MTAATVPWEAFDITHPDHLEWAAATGRCLASDCTDHPKQEGGTNMFVSEDGTVTGSINVARLDEVEPKTDEARAQLDLLKADAKAGREQADRDARRLAEQAQVQDAQLRGGAGTHVADNRDAQGKPVAADQPEQAEETQRLQAEAEAAGVVVDKRWGADRLRQETEQAKAAKTQQNKKG